MPRIASIFQTNNSLLNVIIHNEGSTVALVEFLVIDELFLNYINGIIDTLQIDAVDYKIAIIKNKHTNNEDIAWEEKNKERNAKMEFTMKANTFKNAYACIQQSQITTN